MFASFALGILWAINGAKELLGITPLVDKVPVRFKGHGWTKDYIRGHGQVSLLFGIPQMVLGIISLVIEIGDIPYVLLMLGCAVPSLVFLHLHDRKYTAMLKAELS